MDSKKFPLILAKFLASGDDAIIYDEKEYGTMCIREYLCQYGTPSQLNLYRTCYLVRWPMLRMMINNNREDLVMIVIDNASFEYIFRPMYSYTEKDLSTLIYCIYRGLRDVPRYVLDYIRYNQDLQMSEIEPCFTHCPFRQIIRNYLTIIDGERIKILTQEIKR